MDLLGLSDESLMELTRAGRQDAFAQLIRRHQRSLLSFFARMGADSWDREDMVQETFLRLYASRLQYRPSARLTTFLYTLARHVWVDAWRKCKSRPLAWSAQSAHAVPRSNDQVRRADLSIDVQDALNSLPAKLRVVVVMSVYQRFRYEEISQILGVPVGTVKSRMYLAVQQLREALGAAEQSADGRERALSVEQAGSCLCPR